MAQVKTKITKCFTFLFLIFSSFVFSQIPENSTSIEQIDPNLPDTSKIRLYQEFSKRYDNKNPALSNLYLEKALSLAKKLKNSQLTVSILENLGDNYFRDENFELALRYYESSIKELNELANIEEAGNLYLKLAQTNISINSFEKADYQILKSRELFEKEDLQEKIAKANLVYGELNVILKNTTQGVNIQKEALEWYKENNNIEGEIESNIALGKSFLYLEDLESSLRYFKKALELSNNNLKPENSSAFLHLKIGEVFLLQENLADAMENLKLALNEYIAQNNFKGHVLTLSKIASIYEKQQNYYESIKTLKKASYYYELLNNQLNLSRCYNDIGRLNLKIKNFEEAKKNFEKSLEYSLTKDYFNEIKQTHLGLSELYQEKKDFKQAFRYYILYLQMYDSALNKNTAQELAILNTKFTKEKEVQEIKLLKKQKEISELKFKNINIFIYVLILGSLIIIILSIIFYISSRKKHITNKLLKEQNQKIKIQKEEILTQRNNLEKLYHSLSCQKERIELQRDVISTKSKNITDGIKYAEMIQKAILPTEKDLKTLFPESFLLYTPKDIVSGDFYMIEQKENLIHFAAVDCTGHGVPGAFMSLVGFIELSEVLNQNSFSHPADIIAELNKRVNKTLHQNHKNNANKEGMDLALCTYHKDSFELEFAGAFNPMYIIRNGTLHEYKGDPHPIGISTTNKDINFTNHRIQLHPGDSIYIFTDGYVDQFGGPRRKKFLRKRFKQLLIDNSYSSMKEQKEILHKTFINWKSNFEQIDDVLIIGVKIPEIQ